VILTPKPNLADPVLDSLSEHDAEDVFDGDFAADEIIDDMAPIELELTPDACGQRLDKVISKLVPQYSRSRLQLWVEAGFVTVDGKVAKRNMTAYGDEKIVILPQSAPEDEAFKSEAMELNIVHEDEHIIVINKPAGLVVHPGPGNWSGTLLNGLLHHCPQLAGVPRAGIVHRLDKDTSGLMVVGKTLASQTDLVRQLQARTVKREYFALVWGTPQLSGTIDASMGRHPKDRIKMAVSTSMSSKPAITHYQRIESGLLDRRPVTLVQCQLETGRTHQIRVHMAAQRHPCVGDAMYGADPTISARLGLSRQWLHAMKLEFTHPGTGERVRFESRYPDDLQHALDVLREA